MAAAADNNVAQRLADPATRLSTLDELEHHSGPHAADLAAAAAPALADLLVLDAAEVPHAVFRRVGLLRARLLDEAPADDRPALYGVMHGGGRLEAELNAPGNVIAEAMAKGGAELTREDVLTIAIVRCSYWPSILARDGSLSHRAAGFSGSECMELEMTAGPLGM
eukprot:SAG31_NODE_454_length_15434_cov_39.578285_8_plen_166_part_00